MSLDNAVDSCGNDGGDEEVAAQCIAEPVAAQPQSAASPRPTIGECFPASNKRTFR